MPHLSNAAWQELFGEMGEIIAGYNLLKTHRTAASSSVVSAQESARAAYDDAEPLDQTMLATILDTWQNIATQVKSQEALLVTAAEQFVRDIAAPAVEAPTTTVDDILDRWVDWFQEDSETVDGNAVAAGAAASDPDNDGAATCGAVTVDQYAGNRDFTLECVSDAAGEEEWSVTYRDTVDTDNPVTTGPTNATVEVAYNAAPDPGETQDWPEGGVSFTITNGTTVTEIADASNQMSNWTLTGYTASNTARDDTADPPYKGRLYVDLLDNGGDREVRLFTSNAGAMDDTDSTLVAKGTRTGDGTVTLTAQNSSGLTGQVDVAYTGDDSAIVVDVPQSWIGDQIIFSTTSDDGGTIQTFFREQWGKVFAADVAGAETVPDSLAEY